MQRAPGSRGHGSGPRTQNPRARPHARMRACSADTEAGPWVLSQAVPRVGGPGSSRRPPLVRLTLTNSRRPLKEQAGWASGLPAPGGGVRPPDSQAQPVSRLRTNVIPSLLGCARVAPVLIFYISIFKLDQVENHLCRNVPAGGISNSHVPSTCKALPGSPGSSRHRPLSDTQATRGQGHCSLKGLSRSDTAQGSFGGPRWGPGQLPALLGTHGEASSGETQLLSVGLRKVQLSMPSQTACPAGTLTPARPHPWRLRCRKLQPHALCSSTLWRGPRCQVGWGWAEPGGPQVRGCSTPCPGLWTPPPGP